MPSGASAQVITSYARGGLGELLLGSVAQYMTHHCNRPVAVLHVNKAAAAFVPTYPSLSEVVAEARGGPDSSGGSLEGRNILVPINDSDFSLETCRWILNHLCRKGATD